MAAVAETAEVPSCHPGLPSFYEEVKGVLTTLKQALLRNYLPFAFFVAFVVALSWPQAGSKVLEPQVAGVHVVTFINICTVFFISGLTLNTDDLKAAFTRRTIAGTLFVLLSIIGITPNLGWAMRDLPFSPAEFATGMTIFCVVPTTLGVGVSLVTTARGNVGLAIFATVASNVLGVLIIPLWLKAMLSSGSSGIAKLDISYVDIFVKLLISFFVPSMVGKVVRETVPWVKQWQKQHKMLLGLINNTSLALIIWQTISSGRGIIVNAGFGNMLVVIVSTILIHIVYLIFNTFVVVLLQLPLEEGIAAVIMASQKSAPVAVTVITYITQDTHTQGVLAVPSVIGQLSQIFLGQPIAHCMASIVVRRARSRKQYADTAKTAASVAGLA